MFLLSNKLFSLIYNKLRLGLSVHTPTTYKLKDDYTEYFSVDSRNYIFDTVSYDGYFDYKLSTPWKFVGSLGKIFKTDQFGGFINLDIEYIGYSGMVYNFRKYSTDEYDLENEKDQNRAIRDELKSVINFKLGSEIAMEKFRFRIGGALADSPFIVSDKYNPEITYSFGLGYRENNFYIDFAFIGTDR